MRDKSATDALLDKVERKLFDAPDFSASEMEALHEMVNAWRGWQSLGRAAKWVVGLLAILAATIAAMTTLSTWAKGALRSWLG